MGDRTIFIPDSKSLCAEKRLLGHLYSEILHSTWLLYLQGESIKSDGKNKFKFPPNLLTFRPNSQVTFQRLFVPFVERSYLRLWLTCRPKVLLSTVWLLLLSPKPRLTAGRWRKNN